MADLDPVTKLAEMLDAKARRVQREATDMRRLAARLRDTVAQDTPVSEDTHARPVDHA